ncbi:MAG: nicotinate phosphoribosyltransferase [Mucilaginibacter sp.]
MIEKLRLPVSLLDNDFYKFTMQQAVVRLFPQAMARYHLINRGGHHFPPGFATALRERVDGMATLQLTRHEKQFLVNNCPYLDPLYLDFLEGYRFDPREVDIDQEGDRLTVAIEGHWYRTILWEVPLMAMICDLYYQMTGAIPIPDEEVISRTAEKIGRFRSIGAKVAEFGTRRRYSYHVHRLVLESLRANGGSAFVGTSNVHLAMLYQTRPIGTHAHEWFMYHAAAFGVKQANVLGLQHWVDVYRGDLGIALSDTYTTEVFFRQFDKLFAKLFDGVRQDSGDPLAFADRLIAHYQKMGVDPKSKTIIFTDSLDYEKAARISEHCHGRIGFSFGIGTNLSNDVGVTPMNIVIKMTAAKPFHADWTSVVKLSDSPGKYTGDEETIGLVKAILNIAE